jgi:hypothetical protein
MRRLIRTFWVLVAFVFLVEAWLWDRLEPIVAWVVARIPLKQFKAQVAAWVEHLSPPATLIVFVVPLALLFPLKLAGLWMITRGDLLAATGVLVLAKMVGIAVTAFVFDVTRDKLLLMAWFRRMYDQFMAWRAWAHALVDPIKRRIKTRLHLFAPQRAGRAMRLFLRLRRRVHANQSRPQPPVAAAQRE